VLFVHTCKGSPSTTSEAATPAGMMARGPEGAHLRWNLPLVTAFAHSRALPRGPLPCVLQCTPGCSSAPSRDPSPVAPARGLGPLSAPGPILAAPLWETRGLRGLRGQTKVSAPEVVHWGPDRTREVAHVPLVPCHPAGTTSSPQRSPNHWYRGASRVVGAAQALSSCQGESQEASSGECRAALTIAHIQYHHGSLPRLHPGPQPQRQCSSWRKTGPGSAPGRHATGKATGARPSARGW